MRDWLALPLNTNAAGSSSSSSASTSSAKHQLSSDEGITTDEDEYRYDIINESASTEEEQEVAECQHEGHNEELSTWLSILNVFGVANKLKTKMKNSSSSSSSLSSSTSSLDVKKSREITPKPETDVAIEEEDQHKEESDAGFDDDDDNNDDDEQEQEQEPVQLQRTLSSSSIASSTDTDNSTPASSQIMRSSSTTASKYYHTMTMSKTTNVKIRWNHGGKKVQVTGEFDNWSVSVDMVQDTENSNCHVVEIPMDLSKDIEFKFIVDGEWRYASDLPHRTDWRGNVNNVVYKKENPTTLVNE